MPRNRSQQQRTSAHRRPLSKVCARCRKRKTKCDGKYPVCTPCEAAGEVCRGFDSGAKREVPRSLVRSLENQIAELEMRAGDFVQKSHNLPYLFAARIAQSTLSVVVPSPRSFFHSTVFAASFLHPSYPPLPVLRERRLVSRQQSPNLVTTTEKSNSKHSVLPMVNLKTIPSQAINRMIQNYTQIHLPQYPCVSEPWLREILRQVLQDQADGEGSTQTHTKSPDSGLGHFHYFTLFIVFAISSMTLVWCGEIEARTASEVFYSSALQHLRLMESTEIENLQASLLLAHYAHMNPEKVDNWTCIANAVRIVLDLGLHKTCPDSIDTEREQLRCRLFWVTYGMDRSLCTILQLPLSFPEESITTELAFPFDDRTEDIQPDVESARRKASATHIYLFRQLESEIHRVLHLKEDIPSISEHGIDYWVQDIHQRSDVWYEQAQEFAKYQMLEFRNIGYNHLQTKIHRPTLRLRVRSSEDRMICLESAQALVEEYMKSSIQVRLFYPWHAVHILFEAAAAALDACWISRDIASEQMKSRAKYVLSVSLPQCLHLLTRIGERWEAAKKCSEVLRPIIAKVSVWFDDPINAVLDPESGNSSVEEEIQKLVFPNGVLSLTISPMGSLYTENMMENTFLDGFWSVSDKDFGQWDPNLDWSAMETAWD